MIAEIITDAIKSPINYASSLGLTLGLTLYGYCMKDGNDSLVLSALDSNENVLDIVETCLNYHNLHPDIINAVCAKGLFEIIITDHRDDAILINGAHKRLGYVNSMAFLYEGDDRDFIEFGIKNTDWYYLEGCIIALKQYCISEEYGTRVDNLLETICECGIDPKKHSDSHEALELLKTGDHLLNILDVIYGRSLVFFGENDLSYLTSLCERDLGKVLVLLEKISKNEGTYLSDSTSFKNLIILINDKAKGDLAVSKIISNLKSKHHFEGYEEFSTK